MTDARINRQYKRFLKALKPREIKGYEIINYKELDGDYKYVDKIKLRITFIDRSCMTFRGPLVARAMDDGFFGY